MAVKIEVTNIADIMAGFGKLENQFEEAVAYSISAVGQSVELQAKINASGRPGPNVRTGNLRRSITTRAIKGFGTYASEVAATMSYARVVELGGSNWPPGVKYPYLGPAAQRLSANGTLNRVFTMNLAQRMRGK